MWSGGEAERRHLPLLVPARADSPELLDTTLTQIAVAVGGCLPLLPHDLSQPAPRPLIQPSHVFFGVGEGEVIHPAADEWIQCLADLLNGLSAITPGQTSHFAVQPFESFGSDADAQTSGSSVEAKAQELAICRPVHGTFGFIHLQPHPLLHELLGACHHPLR